MRTLFFASLISLMSSWSSLCAALDMRPTLTVLDMGQGEGILVHCPGSEKNILVDFGSVSERQHVAANALETLKLRLRMDKKLKLKSAPSEIDTMIITHGDEDHYNQIHRLFEGGITVNRVIFGGESSHYTQRIKGVSIFSYLTSKGVPFEVLKDDFPAYLYDTKLTESAAWLKCDDMRSQSDPYLQINMLSANFPLVSSSLAKKKNAASIVLLLQYLDKSNKPLASSFLMGDAEAATEKFMMGNHKTFFPRGLPPVRILKVGHHGSIEGTSEEFVEYIQPTQAVVSASGAKNWNHPACEVFLRIANVKTSKGKPTLDEAAVDFEKLCYYAAKGSTQGEAAYWSDKDAFFTTTVVPDHMDPDVHAGNEVDFFIKDAAQILMFNLSYMN